MDVEARAIFVAAFPDEIGLFGNEVVDDLIRTDPSTGHLDLPGDDRFDLAPVYDFLKAAAKVVPKLLRDYDEWKIRYATVIFKVEVDDFHVELTGADPTIKAEIAASLPRLVALLEARNALRSPG